MVKVKCKQCGVEFWGYPSDKRKFCNHKCYSQSQTKLFGEKSRSYQHGMCGTKFYHTWIHIKARCLNKSSYHYPRWGGRGITICKRWLDFQGFYDDMYQSYQQHTKDNDYTSIERTDNNGNYCKENCIWATRKEQSRNRRNIKLITFQGKTMILTDWAKELNISFALLRDRLGKGWPIEKAFNPKKFTNQFDSPLNN